MITPSKIPDAWDMRSCSALPSWPHPSTSGWCTGQIQDATNPETAFGWVHGRLPEAMQMGEIWIYNLSQSHSNIDAKILKKMSPSILFGTKTVDNDPSHHKQCGSIHNCEHFTWSSTPLEDWATAVSGKFAPTLRPFRLVQNLPYLWDVY